MRAEGEKLGPLAKLEALLNKLGSHPSSVSWPILQETPVTVPTSISTVPLLSLELSGMGLGRAASLWLDSPSAEGPVGGRAAEGRG